MRIAVTALAGLLVSMMVSGSCSQQHADDGGGTPVEGAGDAILFAYFTGEGASGMKYALSHDGRAFRQIEGGRAWLTSKLSAGLIRDPSILRGPEGTWHVVWTTGWWDKGFGVAHSDDLVNWSAPTRAPGMDGVKGAVNTWAPELHWDPERMEYLVLWSSTVRGQFEETAASSETGPDGVGLNHRIWCSTTKDFREWSPGRVFYDPGFNVIDAVIVRDAPRSRWALVCKDETLKPSPRKDLRVAFSPAMQGQYTLAPEPIAAAGTWVEGPTVLEDADGWTIYFDRYRDRKFGAVRTTDWESFQPVRAALPRGVRHGSVVWVSPEVAARLKGS